jgi:pilus assembly protein CpaF
MSSANLSGVDLPVRAIREQTSSALDLLIHLARLNDGSRRVVQVSEVEGMEGDTIVLQDIYYFDYSMGIDEEGRFRGRLKGTGLRPKFTRGLEDRGIELPGDLFEYEAPVKQG